MKLNPNIVVTLLVLILGIAVFAFQLNMQSPGTASVSDAPVLNGNKESDHRAVEDLESDGSANIARQLFERDISQKHKRFLKADLRKLKRFLIVPYRDLLTDQQQDQVTEIATKYFPEYQKIDAEYRSWVSSKRQPAARLESLENIERNVGELTRNARREIQQLLNGEQLKTHFARNQSRAWQTPSVDPSKFSAVDLDKEHTLLFISLPPILRVENIQHDQLKRDPTLTTEQLNKIESIVQQYDDSFDRLLENRNRILEEAYDSTKAQELLLNNRAKVANNMRNIARDIFVNVLTPEQQKRNQKKKKTKQLPAKISTQPTDRKTNSNDSTNSNLKSVQNSKPVFVNLTESAPPERPTNSFAATTAVNDDFDSLVRPFLKKYCFQCHSGERKEMDLDFAAYDTTASLLSASTISEDIVNALNDSYMPPEDAPQPTEQEKRQLQEWLLDAARSFTSAPPPARFRRMNHIEYENTIRDLFEMNHHPFNNPSRIVQTEGYFKPQNKKMSRHVLAISQFTNADRRPSLLPGVSNVPVDRAAEHGFSNEDSALSFSPLMLEKYAELASSIIENRNFPKLAGNWNSLFEFPDETREPAIEHARLVLEKFLSSAFRRPVTETDVARYLNIFESQLTAGFSPQKAMQKTISAVLISSNFLFRNNPETRNKYPQYDLASRISYFLWGSIPDDRLLLAANNGRLDDSKDLTKQVRRMMRDKRIKSLAVDFGMQWLKVNRVVSAFPDEELYPKYYKMRKAPLGIFMMIEQLLLFETILVEDRSILEFIDTDFAYMNRQLMEWYGLDCNSVAGFEPELEQYEDFFRVKLPYRQRGGVLASGAMLVSTSTTTRTSPVYRGAWMLDVMMNRPPPPPPANVPNLDEAHNEKGRLLSVRDKLSIHRNNPACASCHNRIDPLGFAFEHFDAVGHWRHRYRNKSKIDAKGKLYGDTFDGLPSFKDIMLKNNRKFVTAFVEKMMQYALGRRLQLADRNAVTKIVDHTIENDFRFSAVVEGIVLSESFRLSNYNDQN